jgi:proline dehydrogenase
MGAAEVARLTLGERFPFLVADDEHFVPVELGKPGQHRGIIAERLVANGWRVRIYTPYGPDWWPYSLRRMAERPANLRFVLRSLVGR